MVCVYERLVENIDYTKPSCYTIMEAAARIERYLQTEQAAEAKAVAQSAALMTIRPTGKPAASATSLQPSPQGPDPEKTGCGHTTSEVNDSKEQKISEPHQNQFSLPHKKHHQRAETFAGTAHRHVLEMP